MARLDYFAPGVYVEEVSRGSRPIQGVNLSVAGFVGFTEDIRGDAELFEPTLITSWNQYLENFAKAGSDGFTSFGAYLPFAIKGWFDNGGGRCWVVSIGTQEPNATEGAPEIEYEPIVTRAFTTGKRPSLAFRYVTGNEIATGDEADIDSQAIESAENKRIIVIIRPDEPRPPANSDVEPFDTGEFFQIRLERDGEPIQHTVTENGTQKQVDLVYRHLTMDETVNSEVGTFVGTALQDSEYIRVDVIADPGLPLARRPANGSYEVSPPLRKYSVSRWYPEMYGTRKRRSGIRGLFEVDEIAMIACPDLMLAYQREWLTLEQIHAVMEMMITGCETAAPSPAYRMVVLDPPPVKPRKGTMPVAPEQQKPQDVEAWLMDSFGRRSQFAALYYPWIQVVNPSNGKLTFVPPCGHMMGIWCRTDESRGIHKAPANEVPRGVLGLAYDTNFREQEFLNPKGVNCIRKFRDRGTLVWGARTLADPNNEIDWRYISVRRLMSYISKSIELGTQWAVFEPNDEDLWARVTRTVRNFLERIWREGALFGSTPDEAFYVKCDAELNTPETMKLGLLYVEVGVCPVRPAEFVVFRISQWDPTQEQSVG